MATPSGSTGAVSPPARPSSATRRRVAPCRDTSRRDGLTSGISKYVRMRWNATSLYASTLTPPTTTVVVVLSVAMRGGTSTVDKISVRPWSPGTKNWDRHACRGTVLLYSLPSYTNNTQAQRKQSPHPAFSRDC